MKIFFCLFISIFFYSCASVKSSQYSIFDDENKIGLKKVHFENPKRNDPYVQNEKRELTLSIYYPEELDLNGLEKNSVPYIDPLMQKAYAGVLQKQGIVEKVLGHLKSPYYMVNHDISLEERKYPVIIFSPGGGFTPEFYSGIISKIVQKGFIVIGINHTYNAFVSVLKNNVVKKLDDIKIPPEKEVIEITAKDIETVYSYLKLKKPVILMGHSLGAKASMKICSKKGIIECKSLIALDGYTEIPKKINYPYLVIAGSLFEKQVKDSPFFNNKNSVNKLVYIFSDYEHMSFSDWLIIKNYQSDLPVNSFKEKIKTINQKILEFLSK